MNSISLENWQILQFIMWGAGLFVVICVVGAPLAMSVTLRMVVWRLIMFIINTFLVVLVCGTIAYYFFKGYITF